MMDEFSASCAHVVQQVETFVHRLSASRQAFRVGLEEAAVLNAAQSGLWKEYSVGIFIRTYHSFFLSMTSTNCEPTH